MSLPAEAREAWFTVGGCRTQMPQTGPVVLRLYDTNTLGVLTDHGFAELPMKQVGA